MRVRTLGIALPAVALALWTGSVNAQDRETAYAFGGIGGTLDGEPFFHLGGGGEYEIAGGFAGGIELGYAAPFDGTDRGVGVLSINARQRFRDRQRAIVPFASGGYTLLFRNGTESGGNLGGGIDWHAWGRGGIRFEFRAHLVEGALRGAPGAFLF